MKQPSSITSLPLSPDAERRSRMIKYTVAMSIRVLCVLAMLWARGWWLVVFATGAIVLPYIAVVIANVKSNPNRRTVLRPGTLAIRHLPSGPHGEPGPTEGPGPTAAPGSSTPREAEASEADDAGDERGARE
ncbi:MAG: DUF3099 domain-containing protein [Leifsonia sp.]